MLTYRRRIQRGTYIGFELAEYLGRCAARCQQSGSATDFIALQAAIATGFIQRRNVRCHRQPCLGGYRQRLELAGLDEGQDQRCVLKRDFKLARHQFGGHLCAGFVGDVLQIDTGHAFEQLARQMLGGAAAGGAKAQLAGVCPGIGDQLAHRFQRHARMQCQHIGRERHLGQWLEVLDDVVGQFFVERGIEVQRAG